MTPRSRLKVRVPSAPYASGVVRLAAPPRALPAPTPIPVADAAIEVATPRCLHRYAVGNRADIAALYRDHVRRTGKDAVIELDGRQELWIGGVRIGTQPARPAYRVPLLGRLLLPLLRLGLRHELFGRHASAALMRVLTGD